MGVFAYYIDGITKDELTADVIRDAGLGETFRDILVKREPIKSLVAFHSHTYGASDSDEPGKPGVLFFAPPVAEFGWQQPSHAGDPRTWNWQNCGKFWLGTHPDDPVIPEHLQREILVDGLSVELGDHNLWQCPIVRLAMGGSNLPQSLSANGDRVLRSRVTPDYEWAWQVAEDCWGIVTDTHDLSQYDDDGAYFSFELAVKSLSLNYRVWVPEVSFTGIVTTGNWEDILRITIDWEAITQIYQAEESKKKDGLQAVS